MEAATADRIRQLENRIALMRADLEKVGKRWEHVSGVDRQVKAILYADVARRDGVPTESTY